MLPTKSVCCCIDVFWLRTGSELVIVGAFGTDRTFPQIGLICLYNGYRRAILKELDFK